MAGSDDKRVKALRELQQHAVVMLGGHFDFGNGYHGTTYLNPHQLFRQPSTIWRFAQDLIEVVPGSVLDETEIVAGPVMGGALLAHTMAGLLDSRRDLSKPPTSFAPVLMVSGEPQLSRFYATLVVNRRVLLVDDVRNTGQTLARCASLITAAGGIVLATCQIIDRKEAMVDAGVPNIALAEYDAPPNCRAVDCPQCRAGVPVTAF